MISIYCELNQGGKINIQYCLFIWTKYQQFFLNKPKGYRICISYECVGSQIEVTYGPGHRKHGKYGFPFHDSQLSKCREN